VKECSNEKIPEAVIRRMPRYLRYLKDIERMGIDRISSSQMSIDLGLNASQIRRDLNCFGGFGQQGYGYSVAKLKKEVQHILAVDKEYSFVIVGAGNIGKALARYNKLMEHGFRLVGIFDVDTNVIGKEISGVKVRNLDEMEAFFDEKHVDIGIICTPKAVAQSTADRLVLAGVRGIWNFAPVDVEVRKGIALENVHLNDGLNVLCYRMSAEGMESK